MKYFLIGLMAALLFIPFLGAVHLFDWDEINFAEAAREMLVSHNYLQVQIDFHPFWEKPPVFIWMQAACMAVFGVNEFAARLPNALIGIATLVAFFTIGKQLVSEKFGAWWALLYAGCWLPHFYFKSGIIDPAFNFFIFLAVYNVYRIGFSTHKIRLSVLGGIFLGLAVLTKGPVAVLVSGLTLAVYFVANRFRMGVRIGHLLLVALFALLTTAAWFGVEIVQHGWWFVNQFVTYQVRLFQTEDAGHGGPFFYHWIILLVGCFPASIFLFSYLRGKHDKPQEHPEVKDLIQWMWVLFWVVLILFSIVKTKIVHYSSLCYFPLSFLAACQVYRLLEGKAILRKWQVGLMIFVGTVLGIAIGALPLAGLYKAQLIPYIHDRFAVGNLQAAVPWAMTECLYGLSYAAMVIISCVLLLRRKIQAGLLCLFISTIIAIQVTVVHFVPKVEAYSQRAAIAYFQSFTGKDVYVAPLDYKSYAHLFYTRKLPVTDAHYYEEKDWLLNGRLDKPAYFICRVSDSDHWRTDPRLELVGEQNGFVFFKRKQ